MNEDRERVWVVTHWKAKQDRYQLWAILPKSDWWNGCVRGTRGRLRYLPYVEQGLETHPFWVGSLSRKEIIINQVPIFGLQT